MIPPGSFVSSDGISLTVLPYWREGTPAKTKPKLRRGRGTGSRSRTVSFHPDGADNRQIVRHSKMRRNRTNINFPLDISLELGGSQLEHRIQGYRPVRPFEPRPRLERQCRQRYGDMANFDEIHLGGRSVFDDTVRRWGDLRGSISTNGTEVSVPM